MKMHGILPFARELLSKAVNEGDIAIDGTAGNGHDTMFLANLVGVTGAVYSFDIQEAAIQATKARLIDEEVLDRVTLIHDGHEHISEHLPSEHKGEIAGAVFNLGYLPGANSDKSIVTKSKTSIEAVTAVLTHLKQAGILVIVVYHGHPEGKVEKEELLPFVTSLPQEKYHVLQYQYINQRNNPPFIIAIEKR